MEVSGQLYAPSALPPGKEPSVPIGYEDGAGPRAVLDTVVKIKIPSPHRESNPRTPIVQPIAQRYTDRAITALLMMMITMKIVMMVFLVLIFNSGDDYFDDDNGDCGSGGDDKNVAMVITPVFHDMELKFETHQLKELGAITHIARSTHSPVCRKV
jgi:hypothetical protein